MVVLVLTAVPSGLRGLITRWLIEIAPGVFVGKLSTRVRDLLWKRTKRLCTPGKAVLVFQSQSEQGYQILTHGHDWNPVDVDGIILMARPRKQPRPED